MQKSNHMFAPTSALKQPEVIDAQDFDPENYQGRDVVFVKVPAEDKSIGRELNFFGVRLRASIDHHPAIVGAMGGGALGWELLTTRNTVGKMLMTDDEFAEGFRGGALMDIRERNLDAFTRYYSRESKFGAQMLTDPINRMRLQWRVGGEVVQRGVGFMEAIKQWRFRHWTTALTSAAAVGYSALELASGKQHSAEVEKAPNALPASLIGDDAPKDWQGKVFGSLREMSV